MIKILENCTTCHKSITYSLTASNGSNITKATVKNSTSRRTIQFILVAMFMLNIVSANAATTTTQTTETETDAHSTIEFITRGNINKIQRFSAAGSNTINIKRLWSNNILEQSAHRAEMQTDDRETRNINNILSLPVNAKRRPFMEQSKQKTKEQMKQAEQQLPTSSVPLEDLQGNSTSSVIVTVDKDLGECKSLNTMWGDLNPNIYYICDATTNSPLKLQCPEGRGFFKGLGYMGCIPYEEWPACVSVSSLAQVHICDAEHMQQPWETMNPNKFYVCLQQAADPMLVNCEQGKGFVHANVAAANGSGSVSASASDSTNESQRSSSSSNMDVIAATQIVGCANWEKWRSYMKCNEYF